MRTPRPTPTPENTTDNTEANTEANTGGQRITDNTADNAADNTAHAELDLTPNRAHEGVDKVLVRHRVHPGADVEVCDRHGRSGCAGHRT